MPTVTRDSSTRDPSGEEARPPSGDAALAAVMTDEEMERDIEAILDRIDRKLERLKVEQAITMALIERSQV